MVFQGRLHEHWRARFVVSHLSYTSFILCQCEAIVKVHGVFPSRCGNPASSPRLQFHRAHGRDSAQIVTPFVQVGTYPTRNFATLGPLLLRPPFTGASVTSFSPKKLQASLTFRHRAGVRPYTSSYDFAESCVFAKQSPGPFNCASYY